jgi:hypothetical protein
MFEEQSNPQITTVRITVAVVLLALAVILGIWLLTVVSSTITDTKKPAILQKICPDDAKPVDINTPAGRFELPVQAFRGLSYMILFLFLIIPLSIALALLKGGVSLLSPDITKQMRQFRRSNDDCRLAFL